MEADALEFGDPIHSLLTVDSGVLRPMPLVPETPAEDGQLLALRKLSTQDLFAGGVINSHDDARCVHSGLYLYFSALDESHRISQGIATRSGSYWHGIMHRQEGDWSNAKYWFRRVGRHPVFDELEQHRDAAWDPFAFIDRCRAAHSGGRDATELVALQMREWLALMRHCYRHAVGS